MVARVYQGSTAPVSWKMRDHHREQDAHDQRGHAGHEDRVGHGGQDLGPQPGLALGEVGQPLQHRLQRARVLAGPDHVHVQVREDPRMGGHGVGQRGALVDPLLHVAQHALEPLVLHLVHQRGHGLDQGDAGVDQHRQLAGGDGQVLGADAARDPALDVHLARGGLLLRLLAQHLGEVHALALQDAAQRPGRVRLAEPGHRLAGGAQRLVLEDGHYSAFPGWIQGLRPRASGLGRSRYVEYARPHREARRPEVRSLRSEALIGCPRPSRRAPPPPW